jgi:hypothetical protein
MARQQSLLLMEKRHGYNVDSGVEAGSNAQTVEVALDPALNGDRPEPDDPPEGGYGWVVCGAVSLINGFTWGVAAV